MEKVRHAKIDPVLIFAVAVVLTAGSFSLYMIYSRGYPMGVTAHEIMKDREEERSRALAVELESARKEAQSEFLVAPASWNTYSQSALSFRYPSEFDPYEDNSPEDLVLRAHAGLYQFESPFSLVKYSLSKAELTVEEIPIEVFEITRPASDDAILLIDDIDNYRFMSLAQPRELVHRVQFEGAAYEFNLQTESSGQQGLIELMNLIIASIDEGSE